MLVLSRRKNERIVIGGVITVEVLKIRGESVRLGIEAPDDVSVVREELLVKQLVNAEKDEH